MLLFLLTLTSALCGDPNLFLTFGDSLLLTAFVHWFVVACPLDQKQTYVCVLMFAWAMRGCNATGAAETSKHDRRKSPFKACPSQTALCACSRAGFYNCGTLTRGGKITDFYPFPWFLLGKYYHSATCLEVSIPLCAPAYLITA